MVPLVSGANQLRQDVFHAHPAHSDKVLRWRPKIEELITIDVPRLDAAREHFEYVLIEFRKSWQPLWKEAMGDETGPDV